MPAFKNSPEVPPCPRGTIIFIYLGMLLSCVAVSNNAEVHLSTHWFRTYPGRKSIKPDVDYEPQDRVEPFGSRSLKEWRGNENIKRRLWTEALFPKVACENVGAMSPAAIRKV